MMRKEYKRPASIETDRILHGSPDATGCGILAYMTYGLCGFVALL